MVGKTNTKIHSLLTASRTVLNDCVLENGAIVAVNSDKPYVSASGNDYRYVWARDAAFILYALYLQGDNYSQQFASWLIERAENFSNQGLFCRKYATNGAGSYYHHEYQPDQAGALLWSFDATGSYRYKVVRQAAEIIANELCASWQGDSFNKQTYDLWEHHTANPGAEPFLYSLAACASGLEAAAKHIRQENEAKSKEWLSVAGQMKRVVTLSPTSGGFSRRTGDSIDASQIGMVWPFTVGERNRQEKTMARIYGSLIQDYGLRRFEGDVYDGIVQNGLDVNGGAGSWPLLTCWGAVCLNRLGYVEQARNIFENLTDQLDGEWIPEQLLPDGKIGVSPLGWSHAMYVIAASELGYVEPATVL